MRYSLVIILNELSSLFQDLGSSVTPVCDTLLEPLVTVAGHPSFAVRQAVAWTFRSLALASKSNITKYIYQVVGVLKASHIKISSDKTENLSKLRVKFIYYHFFFFELRKQIINKIELKLKIKNNRDKHHVFQH